jgi:hypothetical protein
MRPGAVTMVEPEPDDWALLPGAQFADAYRAQAPAGLDAPAAAASLFERQPAWIAGLMRLRDRLVTPLGLKTTTGELAAPRGTIGVFPVIEAGPLRVVLGFADKHLDFRVVVAAAEVGGASQVTVTTVVLTHNALGGIYLTTILPFHVLIVRTLLAAVARRPVANRR